MRNVTNCHLSTVVWFSVSSGLSLWFSDLAACSLMQPNRVVPCFKASFSSSWLGDIKALETVLASIKKQNNNNNKKKVAQCVDKISFASTASMHYLYVSCYLYNVCLLDLCLHIWSFEKGKRCRTFSRGCYTFQGEATGCHAVKWTLKTCFCHPQLLKIEVSREGEKDSAYCKCPLTCRNDKSRGGWERFCWIEQVVSPQET